MLINDVLEREMAGYRLIDGKITPITSGAEIQAIEEAIAQHQGSHVTHLRDALDKLSDRQQPDYRNSIKESISAVESVCQDVTDNPKATLGEALKSVPNLHPAMAKAFSALNGYTSDSGGIRHALTAGSETPDFAEAKFMLVACSAFVNLLLQEGA